MSISKLLEKAGLVKCHEIQENPDGTINEAGKTKVVTLEELQNKLKHINEDMFKPHIEGKEDYFINPETVYNVAKIEPIKGIWNIFRVLKMHNQLKSMKQNDEAIKQSIIVNMKLDNVSVESILEDAVKRDRALDISGNMIKNKAEKFKSEITQKIDKLKSELSVDEKKLSDLNEKYNKWQTEKIAQETELTKAVSILASGKLISIDEKPDSAPAAAPSGSSPQPQAQPKPQQPAANPQ